ncbi:MAG TPA: nucleotidyltransferase domain-containing protein, partial [Roseiflexaceae bacterium]|nr:nucleotidyltransferase domain-containing protein [Roseiflexaceae bacterium]
MFATFPTATHALALDELLARLAVHPAVDGVVVMGSAGEGALKPASDYDLYVVLSSMPQPLFLLLTTVEQRLTEVYFG